MKQEYVQIRNLADFVQHATPFKKLDLNYLNDLKSFYACYLASKALPNVYDESFLLRFAARNSSVSWLYDTKRNALVSGASCFGSWEIAMSDVPNIIEIDELEKDNPNVSLAGGYSVVFTSVL